MANEAKEMRTLENKLRRAKRNGIELKPQPENMLAARKKLSVASAINKRKVAEAIKNTSEFYERKLKEPKGGKFYLVKCAGRILDTYWGRSKKDVEKQLNRSRTRFSSVTALV